MSFIIVALCCWGLWGIFDKKALETSTSQNVIITHYILHAIQIPILICVLNFISPHWHLSFSVMLWSGLAAVAYAVASTAYLTAMSKADASYVLGITACYPVIAIGLAVLFLGETINLERCAGAAAVCLGVYIISLPSSNLGNGSKLKISKIAALCLVTATLAWAVWGIIDKKAVSIATPLEICLGKYIWDLLLLPILLCVYNKQGHTIIIKNKRTWVFCSLSAICLAFGAWGYLSAMTNYCASYVISITACYPVFMYILAITVLKEQFNQTRFAGITLIVIGGIMVQMAQWTVGPSTNQLQNWRSSRQFQSIESKDLLALNRESFSKLNKP